MHQAGPAVPRVPVSRPDRFPPATRSFIVGTARATEQRHDWALPRSFDRVEQYFSQGPNSVRALGGEPTTRVIVSRTIAASQTREGNHTVAAMLIELEE